jgi:hypothetical protein
MTMTDTRATVRLSFAQLRRIAGIASAFGATDKAARPQARTAVIEVNRNSISLWVSDTYRAAIYTEPNGTNEAVGVIGLDVRELGKAVTAVGKVAGRGKNGAAVPVTVTATQDGAEILASGVAVTVPVPVGHESPDEWRATLGRLVVPYLPEMAKHTPPTGGQTLAPDTLRALANAGDAVGAVAWHHVGGGDDGAPVLYEAVPVVRFDPPAWTLSALVMPVRVRNIPTRAHK